jgi:hypothetical protein
MAFVTAETADLPADIAEKAVGIHQNLSNTVARIREDKRLTPEAKRADITQAYNSAKEAMQSVQADLQQQQEAIKTDRVFRRVFGNSSATGADIIAARDADDRASRLESADEAASALARAEKNQDASLARAIALRAYQEAKSPFARGWAEVLSSYSGSRPGAAEDVAELARLSSDSLEKSMARGFVFNVTAPSEVGRF